MSMTAPSPFETLLLPPAERGMATGACFLAIGLGNMSLSSAHEDRLGLKTGADSEEWPVMALDVCLKRLSMTELAEVWSKIEEYEDGSKLEAADEWSKIDSSEWVKTEEGFSFVLSLLDHQTLLSELGFDDLMYRSIGSALSEDESALPNRLSKDGSRCARPRSPASATAPTRRLNAKSFAIFLC